MLLVLGVLGIVCVQGMLLPLTASFSPPPSPCTFQTEHAGFAQKSETDLGLNNLTAFAAKLFLIRMDFGLKKRASWLEEGSFSEALLQWEGKGLGAIPVSGLGQAGGVTPTLGCWCAAGASRAGAVCTA